MRQTQPGPVLFSWRMASLGRAMDWVGVTRWQTVKSFCVKNASFSMKTMQLTDRRDGGALQRRTL